MRAQIFQPEDAFHRQAVQMLEQGEGCGGQLVPRRRLVGASQPSGDRPFEQRQTFLGGDGLEQPQDAFFLHRLDDDERMARTDQGAEIMHTRGERHQRAMLARRPRPSKKTGDCYGERDAGAGMDLAQRKPMVAERWSGGAPLRVAVRSMIDLLFHDPPRRLL